MDPLQQHNLREIESLNQRGGRTLSFVDLIRAGTMSEEMVAYCWTAIAGGASFLTAARPGGAGKSTVLANLLVLLPPGERIETFTERLTPQTPLRSEEGERLCSLAHEIGAGRWHGYIWGAQVREFIALKARGCRLAACLHADTLEEVADSLCAPPLSCTLEERRMFDLVLFLHILPRGRTVVGVHHATPTGYHPALAWNPATRQWALDLSGIDCDEYERRLQAVRGIVAEGQEPFERVRARVLETYRET